MYISILSCAIYTTRFFWASNTVYHNNLSGLFILGRSIIVGVCRLARSRDWLGRMTGSAWIDSDATKVNRFIDFPLEVEPVHLGHGRLFRARSQLSRHLSSLVDSWGTVCLPANFGTPRGRARSYNVSASSDPLGSQRRRLFLPGNWEGRINKRSELGRFNCGERA
jgi:hypothetical protein